MPETRFTQKPKKRQTKQVDEDETLQTETGLSEDKKRKLMELDDFIGGVLEDAGEEFLDEFKQVEGE